jgi:hypothetical protein
MYSSSFYNFLASTAQLGNVELHRISNQISKNKLISAVGLNEAENFNDLNFFWLKEKGHFFFDNRLKNKFKLLASIPKNILTEEELVNRVQNCSFYLNDDKEFAVHLRNIMADFFLLEVDIPEYSDSLSFRFNVYFDEGLGGRKLSIPLTNLFLIKPDYYSNMTDIELKFWVRTKCVPMNNGISMCTNNSIDELAFFYINLLGEQAKW